MKKDQEAYEAMKEIEAKGTDQGEYGEGVAVYGSGFRNGEFHVICGMEPTRPECVGLGP